MWTPTLVLLAIAALAACASVGGGLYEASVVDPYWPKRPGIIQPIRGGISRRRFWVPAHLAFEVLLIAGQIVGWSDRGARIALVVAPSSTRQSQAGGRVAACCACRWAWSRARRCWPRW